jgi:intracellular sulfur oxidation DsrE/DsrF family protein
MTTRKAFIAASSLFALAPAVAQATPSPGPSPKMRGRKVEELTFTFDRARFEQILGKPAKHKQCFGATKLDGGSVMYGMSNSIDAYVDYLKEPAGAMQAVAVLYHGAAIALAMNDSIWNRYLTPLFHDKTFLRNLPPPEYGEITHLTLGKGNPFLHSASADPDDVSIERLVSEGSSFFVCHNAIAGFSGIVADVVKQPRKKVHDAILAGIVPGALVVPAGVMAINACQEAKFTYIQSSL